ncbi:S-layer homology domain-containing protein [Anaerotignum sp.]|uniref:S-layer homology domain-containing protein n=1 Tax=Anaerotignum sp. TaxID=2039241 RepID=UPI002A90FE50|nr:S-layer homology domain-containing protein [Anaerotignum sp.]MDY5414359.1 S-layer homology domain-containing protein [Anaerotignum sp.]
MMRKRIFAAFVCLCMLMALVPSMAYANDTVYTGGLCEHHPQHDDACGYSEATAEVPCSHEHTEDCYQLVTNCVHEHTAECYSEGNAEPICGHVCSEDSGCITKELNCNHEHDENCGYVSATAGTPCTYDCKICNAPAAEEPECICDTKCTEEEPNADCPVCSAEGADLSACKGAVSMPLGVQRNVENILYLDENGTQQTAASATQVTSSDTQWQNGWYVVDSDVTINERVTVAGSVQLILANDCTLTAQKGINVSENNSFTVYAQSTDENAGKLTAGYDDRFDSCIGGKRRETNGNITINGGTIRLSSSNGAGIGSGRERNSTGDITINGGHIHISTSSGAGMGAGAGAQNDSNITINGGNIDITVEAASAGIGGGSGAGTKYGNNNGTIRITGGTVIANVDYSTSSNTGGAGIGGGNLGDGGTIIISGGDISVHAGTGAGIGGGATGKGGNVTITGGTVTATSKLGASIGAGASNSERGTLTIAPASGKVITADAGTDKNSSIPLEGSPFTNSKEVINQLTGTKYFHSETKNMTVITQHPENQRVNDGSSATFTISADGDNLTYQWQQSTGNEGSWTNINGANLSSYTTGTTTMDMSGYQYRCIVTGADGSVTSHAATLTVEAIPVAEVKLNKNNITLTVGDIETLTATVEPTNATNKTVMWSSSDNTVATVDSQTGEVKAISRGEAVITAEAEDGKGAKAICEVEVKQLVTGISLNKTELSLYTGREEKLTATVNPDNANDPTLIWSSDNEDVATVDQNGNVKAISQGKAVITVTANDDSGKTATCTVTVKKKSSGGSVFFWDLKFDTNGGSKIDTVTEWEYSTIDLDEYVPKKEGYKFVGWYADEDLTNKIDEVYLTEDTTVYAKWEKIAEEVPEEPEETEEIKEPETISFLDVKESDWFYEAVFYAVENGLMSGMSEDIFAPNTPLTREMLAVVLYNVEGQQESAEANTFTDVKGDMWYTDAILWANANGIVAGYDNGAYGVGDLITREQFAVMLYRYAQFKDYDTTQGGMAAREYSDYEAISDYARPAVAWAVNAGIMGGMDNGTLNPQGKATRAEAATMLMNFCENVVK